MSLLFTCTQLNLSLLNKCRHLFKKNLTDPNIWTVVSVYCILLATVYISILPHQTICLKLMAMSQQKETEMDEETRWWQVGHNGRREDVLLPLLAVTDIASFFLFVLPSIGITTISTHWKLKSVGLDCGRHMGATKRLTGELLNEHNEEFIVIMSN